MNTNGKIASGMKSQTFLIGFILLFIPAISLFTAPLHSQEITRRDDGERKINLSGRQRMLTQFLTKATCFVALGKRIDHHKNWMVSTHWLFDTTLAGLQKGSAITGMLPEENPGILGKLKEVEQHWAVFGPAVLAIKSGDEIDQGALATVFERNVPTLTVMNQAVSLFEKAYGGQGIVDPGIAKALNVSGRQRMLSQKSSKEFCLVALGYKEKENREALGKTIKLFNASLIRLQQGSEEMGIPPPVGQVADQLRIVAKNWEPLFEVFQRVASGGEIADADIEAVLNTNEVVLREMNKAVWLYEEVY